VVIRLSFALIAENIFFAVRVVNAWNSLPNEIVSKNQLLLFKNRLRQVDLSRFMVGKL